MSSFDPRPYMQNLAKQGQSPRWYLKPIGAILWFRSEFGFDGSIDTEPREFVNSAVVVARVIVNGIVIASGMAAVRSGAGTTWEGREYEKAETAAIRRALEVAGYCAEKVELLYPQNRPQNAPQAEKPRETPPPAVSTPKSAKNAPNGENLWIRDATAFWSQVHPLYDSPKHATNSVNAMREKGAITDAMTVDEAVAAVRAHLQLDDVEM